MNTIGINHQGVDLRQAVIQQEMARAEQLQEEMGQKFWPMIGTANQVAFMAIDDAVEAMRAVGWLRHQEKQKAQRALEEYKRYERAAYEHFLEPGDDRYALWQDLVGRAAEKLQPDVQKLYFAIKNVIDKCGVAHSDVLAQIQTGVALITLSTLMYDTMAAQYQRQTLVHIADAFRGGRLTAVERNWLQVGEATGRKVMKTVNLKDDAACQLGINVILTRYQSAEFLNEAAGEALSVNQKFDYLIK